MTMKLLAQSERDFIVSSYVIPDIYDLIWILIQYGKNIIYSDMIYFAAKNRNSKNIYLRLDVSKGSFELSDDGEGLDLQELIKSSLLLKRNLIKKLLQYFPV